MIISDLNYLEASEGEVFGGLLVGPNLNTFENSNIVVREVVSINKFVRSDAEVSGNLATAQANSLGFKNSLAQTSTLTQPGVTSSSSISAGN